MITNVFADLSRNLPDELFTTLLDATNVRIERIISHGHGSPEGFWYDQDRHEWVILLNGAARLRFEDATVEMKPGDFVNIPVHKNHRVEWTTPDEPTIWLAVHYGNPTGDADGSQDRRKTRTEDRRGDCRGHREDGPQDDFTQLPWHSTR